MCVVGRVSNQSSPFILREEESLKGSLKDGNRGRSFLKARLCRFWIPCFARANHSHGFSPHLNAEGFQSV